MTNAKKIVNIEAKFNVMLGKMTIFGTMYNVELSVGDIQQCIFRKCIVDEVLSDGSLVRLSLVNYNLDNEPSAKKVVKKEEPVQPKVFAETVEVKETISITPIVEEVSDVVEEVEEVSDVVEEEISDIPIHDLKGTPVTPSGNKNYDNKRRTR